MYPSCHVPGGAGNLRFNRWYFQGALRAGRGRYKQQVIEALLVDNTYCDTCKRKFSEANPEVMSSMCLGCFVMKRTELEFTGAVWHDKQGVPQYLFADGCGHITMASPDSLTVQESIEATLRYWGFTLPDHAMIGQINTQLSPYRWHSLYSDPRQYAVIATHQPAYGAKLLIFLLQRDGSALLLDRRLKRVRDLLATAKAEIIAGKGGKELEEYGSWYYPTDYRCIGGWPTW